MKLIPVIPAFLSAALLLSSPQGTVPLKDASEYRDHAEIGGVPLGALILNEAQLKQRFVTGITGEYLVVEVAVYPKEGTGLKIRPDQFVLYVAGDDRALKSENPKVIAASVQKSENSRRDIEIIPHVGVGYESGRRGYDPQTGTYGRSGGIYTSTGVAVVLGPSSPSADPKNQEVMALELSEKGLPEGTFEKPVAGHLYFRVGRETLKNDKARFKLSCDLNGAQSSLDLSR
jgi:hypothetical protein